VSAAGTRPKNDRAEKRPPMSGSFRKTWRKPNSRAHSSSFDPGSVMAAKCPPAFSLPSLSQAHP